MAEDKIYIGKAIFSWQIKEYEGGKKSNRWFLIIGLICFALIILAIFTANFLFAIIILLFVFVVVLREFYIPEYFTFKITDSGIVIGSKFYSFKDIKNFFVVYEPPDSKYLYFRLKSVSPLLSINLDDQNPIKVREYLLQYLEEDLDREEEAFADTINRLLKL